MKTATGIKGMTRHIGVCAPSTKQFISTNDAFPNHWMNASVNNKMFDDDRNFRELNESINSKLMDWPMTPVVINHNGDDADSAIHHSFRNRRYGMEDPWST